MEQQYVSCVLERAEKALDYARFKKMSLLSISLDQLTFGCAHLQQALSSSSCSLSEAEKWLEQAVTGLRAAGVQHHLPRGLLARAALHRHTRDFARARQDLQEVFDITDGSGMRLHLTDYHLEMARLLMAEELGGEGIHHHITAAECLINETGYHRRDGELAELKQHSA
ncbi:hypothetical protein [Thiothrix eikelboomii]|uniref:hypothetical protein n=1 Tax=Thiothrix eikelboomii TaxID=92487 RepID=UPI003BAFABAA